VNNNNNNNNNIEPLPFDIDKFIECQYNRTHPLETKSGYEPIFNREVKDFKEILMNLLRPENQLKPIAYSFEKFRQKAANTEAILFDESIKIMSVKNHTQVKGLKEKREREGYNNTHSWQKIHNFVDKDLAEFNILESRSIAEDKTLGPLCTRTANLFTGRVGTMKFYHVDGVGGFGQILNSGGHKILFLADWFEVQKNNLAEKFYCAENPKIVDITVLATLKSFRWCSLKYGQTFYFPAWTYHAIYNAADTDFASIGFIPAIPRIVEHWLPFILHNSHTLLPANRKAEVRKILERNMVKRKWPEVIIKKILSTIDGAVQSPNNNNNNNNNSNNKSSPNLNSQVSSSKHTVT
jgi:hypothetical protein